MPVELSAGRDPAGIRTSHYGDRVKVECPTGSGHVDAPRRSRRRDFAPADLDLRAGGRTADGRSSAALSRTSRTRLARRSPVLRVFPRRQRRRHRRRAPDRLDRAGRRPHGEPRGGAGAGGEPAHRGARARAARLPPARRLTAAPPAVGPARSRTAELRRGISQVRPQCRPRKEPATDLGCRDRRERRTSRREPACVAGVWKDQAATLPRSVLR